MRNRQFRTLLEDLDAEYGAIVFFANARWLSRGRALERITSLFEEIKQFLTDQKAMKDYSVILNKTWQFDLFFLTDITSHLNVLNTKLQGKNRVICDLAQTVREFILKLRLIKAQMARGEMTSFPNLINVVNDRMFKRDRYVGWLGKLLNEFETRFTDFEKFRPVFALLKNPGNADIADAQSLSELLEVNKTDLENDLLIILSSLENFSNQSVPQMWHKILNSNEFAVLHIVIPKLLSMFGSTYLCESSFSNMKFRKSKFRSQITSEHLESEMRCSLTEFIPNIKQIVHEKGCQISH